MKETANKTFLVSCLACSLTLMMGATCASETSVDFHWTTLRNFLEGKTHQKLRVFEKVDKKGRSLRKRIWQKDEEN
jgi:hypothetical protein